MARFFYPAGATPAPAGDPWRLDAAGTVHTSWGASVWVDPTFRGHTDGPNDYFDSLPSAYNLSAVAEAEEEQAEEGTAAEKDKKDETDEKKEKDEKKEQLTPIDRIEYHLLEDFATDWTDGQDWEGFFLFFSHCARELMLLAYVHHTAKLATHLVVRPGALIRPNCLTPLLTLTDCHSTDCC